MNQKEFADKIGISPATLNYYCKQKGMLEGQTGIEPEKCYDWFMKTGRTDMAAKVRKAFKFGAEKKVVELYKNVPIKNVSEEVLPPTGKKLPYSNLYKVFEERQPFKFILGGTVAKRKLLKTVLDRYMKPFSFPFPQDKKVYFIVGVEGFFYSLSAVSKKAYKETPYPEYFPDTNTIKENIVLKRKEEINTLKEIQHFPEGSTAHPLLVRVNKIEELGRRFESFMVLLRELISDIE